jgi:DNA-binding NarL/FixJ family response regulator
MIRVLVYSPALALRTGLSALLSGDKDLELVGDASSLDDLGDLHDLDVIVLAAGSEALDHLESQLEALEPPPALLLISDESEGAEQLAELPLRAWGLLPSDSSEEELFAALHALHEGLIVGSAPLIQPMLGLAAGIKVAHSNQELDELTPRESEVLQLLSHGLANKQIALQLGISEHTVKFHGSAIYAKLSVTNRTEAVRQAARRGLIVL